MRLFITLLFFVLTQAPCPGQFTDRVWCFGDSVKMKFTSGGVVMDNPSGLFSPKPAGSICDSSGSLLFYVGLYTSNPTVTTSYRGAIFNNSDQIVPGGDSLEIEESNSDGLIILPLDGGIVNKYYLTCCAIKKPMHF